MEQRPEASEIFLRADEALEETRERRLARHALDAEQIRYQRIAAQLGHLREFHRAAEQALHKAEYIGQR
ncbi:MAG: hypothetical protein HY736_02960 [Verrucomicrobia bacterium]|nr:hypothetical protein [Verrucomicrobiota bacterium]